jgi:HEAT repeat protein
MALWSRLWRLLRRRNELASNQPPSPVKPATSAPVGAALREAIRPASPAPRRPPAQPTNVRVASLTADLTHRDTHRRQRAAVGLGQIGPAAIESIPALVRALVDLQPAVRKSAAEALARIDRDWARHDFAASAAPELVHALVSRFSEVAEEAFSVLVRLGPLAVPALVAGVKDTEKDLRQAASARALGRIGPPASAAVPALMWALTREHTHVRQAAAEALAGIGPAVGDAVPRLVPALGDWAPAVRQAAAQALAHAGVKAAVAAPALLQLLADREESVRKAGVSALGACGADAVPLLMRVFTSPGRDLCWMFEHLMDELESRRLWSDIDETAFWREPLKALRNRQWYVQNLLEDWFAELHQGAATALGLIGQPSEPAVPVLIQALGDSSGVRRAAVWALGQIGPAADSAVPGLLAALTDPNEAVRAVAAESLGQVAPFWRGSPAAAAALPGLLRLLNEEGPLAQPALSALELMGAAAVPALTEALKSDEPAVRAGAATALGRIGAPARPAVAALRGVLEDEHGWVRSAAAHAIRQMGEAPS